MKRSRADVYDSSHGESYGQSHVRESDLGGRGGGSHIDGKPELTISDAFSYLKEVKDMFPNQREKYNMFLVVMNDFKRKRIDILGVIAKAKELFKGHPSLLLGLNPFLPKGYEIIINDEDEKKVDFAQALNLMKKIKIRLGNCKSFIDILSMYRKEHMDVNEVYREVALLFSDHPDLLDDFARCMPYSSTVKSLSNLDDDKTLMK